MEGAEVLREIKSIKPNVRIIVITGYPSSEMMDRALKLGPFGIMNKPFNYTDIITAMDNFMGVK